MALLTVPVPTQILLFSNDATEVTYTDGSQLQLSPCGAVFVHTKQVKQTAHPLQQLHRVQQRTQFVTSEFRAKVLEALEFRNRFAERPYICADLIDGKDLVNTHTDVHCVKWPKQPYGSEMVKTQPDGSVCVSSLDGYASLTLAPHQQEFNVRFLTKVSKPQSRNTQTCESKNPIRKKRAHHVNTMEHDGSFTDIQDISNKSENREKDEKSCHGDSQIRNPFVWLVQHYSISSCPSHWKQALDLALKTHRDVTNGDSNAKLHECGEEAQSEKCIDRGTGDVVTSVLPASLPLNCPASHLHMWTREAYGVDNIQDGVYSVRQEKLKVICTDGIIYRLHWGSRPVVEVYPGDGSIIRSKGPTGCFFTLYWYENSRVEERVYSAENPPPDTTTRPYSIRRLMGTAARLFQHVRREDSSLIDNYSNCCWKMKTSTRLPSMPVPASVLEESKIPELGKFTAYTDGRVRIVFTDRTMLDMKWDFSIRLRKGKDSNSDMEEENDDSENNPPLHSFSLPKIRSDQAIPTGACRLLLSNGQYQLVSLHQPCGFSKYISIAKEWAAWVNSSPNERLNFYDSTVHNINKGRAVASELKKIQTFNYLCENSSAQPSQGVIRPQASYAHADSVPGPAMVRDVLKKMSQTINDIDNILDQKS